MERAANVIPLPLSLEQDRECSPKKLKSIKQNHLINKINFLNFNESPLQVRLRHCVFSQTVITTPAIPGPCNGDQVTCQWKSPPALTLDNYIVDHILVPDQQRSFLFHPLDAVLSEEGVTFRLPESCEPVETRHSKRVACDGISVKIIQNSSTSEGGLADLNSEAFRVHLRNTPQIGAPWINKSLPVIVILANDEETLYAGECTINSLRGRNLVLSPRNTNIRRFSPRKHRGNRLVLNPPPHIIFRHPLTGQLWDFKAADISGTGFKIDTSRKNSPLFPGLILPEVEISFGNAAFGCRCQVIYRNNAGDSDTISFGISIINMEQRSHLQLMSILQEGPGKKTFLNPKVDMPALWNFFFETGFIYPDKYLTLAEHKGSFKSIYDTLYNENPSIAHHFISQDRGTILGHLSMLRFYPRTWVVHHHTANKSSGKLGGLDVLKQANAFINETHRILSANMDYILCYYRPENRFPCKVFGGAARALSDNEKCSIDSFAYFILSKTSTTPSWNSTPQITFQKASEEDLNELRYFYESVSNGLLLDATEMRGNAGTFADLQGSFETVGLKRERHEYSLKVGTKTAAIIYLDISDAGLNMSGLTTALTVFVLHEDLPLDNLLTILKLVESKHKQSTLPVMVYPSTYIEKHADFQYKHYQAWVLNVGDFDEYLEFFSNLVPRNAI